MIKEENFLKLCFPERLEEFHRNENKFELAMVNKPLVLELLRFDCSCAVIIQKGVDYIKKVTICLLPFMVLNCLREADFPR